MNSNPPQTTNYEILPDDYPKYDLSFKLIIIGNSGVGKSCLSVKATKNIFDENNMATVGFEFFSFNVRLDDKIIKLQIWDTCGQEIYRSLITNFYRNSSLAIIVFSLIDKNSFEDIDIWLKELKLHSNPDIKVFLIGNKVDLVDQRVISVQEALKYKETFGFDFYMETSAKTGTNTQEFFIEAAKTLYSDFNRYQIQGQGIGGGVGVGGGMGLGKDGRKISGMKSIGSNNVKLIEKEDEANKGCCK